MARKGLIKEITKKTGEPEEKEFQAEGIEGTKEEAKEKKHITCEDVLKTLREKGYKV